jgi:hypothetical protein
MGRLDLPDPVRDEDVWVSAHTLTRSRLCDERGCDQDAQAGDTKCLECRRGDSTLMRLRRVMGG